MLSTQQSSTQQSSTQQSSTQQSSTQQSSTQQSSTQQSSAQQSSTQQSSAHQTFRSTVSRISPLWMILLICAASSLLLLALQALRVGMGFHVHPLGEDRVWIRMMANYPGFEMDRQWWSLASRN